jgi:PPK2 family polyphosphate:nucleotide phosphotransferase
MVKNYLLPRSGNAKLKEYDPEDTGPFHNKEEVLEEFKALKTKLQNLQDKLFAEKKKSLLIVFQGMDCSGKDGVIKKVLSSINPQGFQVTSFKKPTAEELSHDFLWRAHRAVPARGYIAAFNRSYYEDVLVTRVHGLIPKQEAEHRMKHIRNFEKLLADSDVQILKFFLHISEEFQIQKIEERLSNPKKKWKFDPSDLQERQYWDAYRGAYEDVFHSCNTKEAPWYVIPANHRWFRDYLVLKIVVKTLESMDPKYPDPDPQLEDVIRSLELPQKHI